MGNGGVKSLIEGNRFGDRWPSSGLIAIAHMLSSQPKLHLHGFDFFKQIGAWRAMAPTLCERRFPSLAARRPAAHAC